MSNKTAADILTKLDDLAPLLDELNSIENDPEIKELMQYDNAAVNQSVYDDYIASPEYRVEVEAAGWRFSEFMEYIRNVYIVEKNFLISELVDCYPPALQVIMRDMNAALTCVRRKEKIVARERELKRYISNLHNSIGSTSIKCLVPVKYIKTSKALQPLRRYLVAKRDGHIWCSLASDMAL